MHELVSHEYGTESHKQPRVAFVILFLRSLIVFIILRPCKIYAITVSVLNHVPTTAGSSKGRVHGAAAGGERDVG